MPIDKFASTDSVIAPARDYFAIEPSDALDLPRLPKAIYVGTGGDLAVTPEAGGEDVVFRNVPDGTILPIRPRMILLTGTSAADIVGLI
jgi:hypothetical protein